MVERSAHEEEVVERHLERQLIELGGTRRVGPEKAASAGDAVRVNSAHSLARAR
jgi:hypothetical protein